MDQKSIDKRVGILDWGIIFSFLIMLVIIYIPLNIWAEEEKYKKDSRNRMEIISNAEEFYKEITGSYTTDGEKLFFLVDAAIDSTIADSLFFGKQNIFFRDKSFEVNISKGFLDRADTTFSVGVKRKINVIDTIFTVKMKNPELNTFDTTYVNTNDIDNIKQDSLFIKIINFNETSYSETFTDYISKKFKLTNNLLNCPLTGKPYELIINNTDPEEVFFKVKSPVPIDYKERRFFFFSFESGEHGYIEDKKKSWSAK